MSSPGRSHVLHRRGYTFEFEVGEGIFGATQVVRDRKTGGLKTCKVVSKSLLRDPDSACARLRQLCELRLPQVNSISDVVEDSETIFILSERCCGGDLNDWMDHIDEQHWLQEDVIAAYVAQVLVALAHCHANHVYHHDLSPSSILLTSRMPDATVLVSDFGIQAVLDPDNAMARRSPTPYMAPELVSDQGRLLGGGAPDVWSVGAIAHLLLVGREPVSESSWDISTGNLLRRLGSGDEWAARSTASRDFVHRLLQPAGHRPTAARMLQHPWLRNTIIPRIVHGRPGHEDMHHRMVCYTAAVLLVPALLLHGDLCRLLLAFQRADGDYDGLVLRSVAQELLQEHSVHETTADSFGEDQIEDALEIADVRGTGVLDLCGVVVAAILAQRLPRHTATSPGPSRAGELAPLLAERFFEVYGKVRQPTINVSRLPMQLRNAAGRELEVHGGVDFGDILAAFTEFAAIDRQTFMAKLCQNAGRGTPLAYAQDDDEVEEVGDLDSDPGTDSSWEPLDGLNAFLGGALERCGLLLESKRLVKKFLDLHCVQCITAG